MTKLKLFSMLSMLLGGLLLNTQRVAAQTEEEFTAEFTQYFSNHTDAETFDYILARMAGITAQSIIESELETEILNAAFSFTRNRKRQTSTGTSSATALRSRTHTTRNLVAGPGTYSW